MQRKTKVILAKEKLESIELMFTRLKEKLSKNQKIKGNYEKLVEGIKEYNCGLKYKEWDLCYTACSRVYILFKITNYLSDSRLKEQIKGMMKEIAKDYFSEDNSTQLKFFFDYSK